VRLAFLLLLFYLFTFETAAKRLEILFMRDAPPLYTIVGQLVGWTLDRTADFPKSQRFTFGQRLDNLSLDCLQQVVRAIYSPGKQRSGHLSELNLKLEELRVLWRLVQQRGWVSQRQLLYVGGVLDELGRMAGGWMKSQRNQTNA
jgi:hypothetical protein